MCDSRRVVQDQTSDRPIRVRRATPRSAAAVAGLLIAEAAVLGQVLDRSAAVVGVLGPAVAIAAVMGQGVTIGAAGIDRRGVGTIPWDDIERVEVRSRLGGLVKSARLRLRPGQRSNLTDSVALGGLGRGWPENQLGRALARYCPRLVAASR